MKKSSIKKALVIGIIISFVGTSVIPTINGNDRNIIYVTDNGGANYTSIQDATDSVTLIRMNNNDLIDTNSEEIYVTKEISIIFEEDFESGWNDWWADNGVWEIGNPTAGPGSAHSGENCSGTVLGGGYPPNTDSRFVSPTVQLPTVASSEEIQLHFWHWFSYGDDYGQIEISVYNESAEEWEPWQPVSEKFIYYSPVWSLTQVDLTPYAGRRVRIAFAHYADHYGESTGWYVDDVSIDKVTPVFQSPEDFESGWNDWWADKGVWEIGNPTAGPDSAHSGENCSGTVLGGGYPPYTDSRFVSPTVQLPTVPSSEEIRLHFWHWFSYSRGDYGQIEISVYNESAEEWEPWQTVSEKFTETSTIWSPTQVDLTPYAGRRVRIAFAHYADSYGESTGWYVDDVEITGLNQPPVALFSYLPLDPIVNQTITFNASSSYDPDGFIVSYKWDFDDGTNKSGVVVNHSYSFAGNYTITLTVTDDDGAIDECWEQIQITIIDMTVPEITDNTLTTGYTGDSFTFNATVTDNVQISTVWVEYWYGAGSHTNVSMSNVAGDYWEKTIVIDDTLDILYYIISANDTSNNWNHTDIDDVSIYDNDNPEIADVQANPSIQNIGGYVNISATVIDNIDVDEVYLHIEYPDSGIKDFAIKRGIIENFSITQNKTGDTYYCNKTYDYPGVYTYHIWANDTSNNHNISGDYTFEIINQPPYLPSNPSPENGTTDVNIDADISWDGGDPDPGDTVTYDVYFGDSSPPSQVATGQSDTSYDPGTLEYSTTYYWKIVAWDNHGASTESLIWSFTTEEEPVYEPDLDCSGTLSWTGVTPGDTVTGSFTVSNVGDPGSLLDWEIKSYPDWGTWTFTPMSGDDLKPEDGIFTVEVEVVAPNQQEQNFTGQIKIVNIHDASDYCIIDVSLATPMSQISIHSQSNLIQFMSRIFRNSI